MKVSELMQRHVVTAREEQSLKELAAELFDHGISGMPVVGADGTVAEILLNPVGGPYGPLPSDPSRFPASIYPRTAVCHILHGRPGVRCTRAGLLLNAGGGDRSCSSQPSPSSSPSPR